MRSTHKGGEEAKMDNSDDALRKPQKEIEDYEHVYSQRTQFFSTYNPDMIEEALADYLRNQAKVEPKVHQKKYKCRFTLASKDMGD